MNLEACVRILTPARKTLAARITLVKIKGRV